MHNELFHALRLPALCFSVPIIAQPRLREKSFSKICLFSSQQKRDAPFGTSRFFWFLPLDAAEAIPVEAIQHQQDQGDQHRADRQGDPGRQGEAGDQIAQGADCRHQGGIGQLGLHMADVLAGSAGGGQDGGIGDGGAVVAVHGPGQGGAQGGDQQRLGVGRSADHGDDGDQHAEGAPGRAHGKAHERRDDKDQKRQEA